jgi:hypothetical protein
LPLVHHLRRCATHWDQELKKEVKSMINIFKLNENAILVQQQRNRALKTDVDRLLEQVLHADIVSVIMNSIYLDGTSKFVDAHSVDNDLWKGT